MKTEIYQIVFWVLMSAFVFFAGWILFPQTANEVYNILRSGEVRTRVAEIAGQMKLRFLGFIGAVRVFRTLLSVAAMLAFCAALVMFLVLVF